MQIRMTVPDELYDQYRELAEKQGFAVTKLNQILFEKALKEWIEEAVVHEEYYCQRCGKVKNGNEVYLFNEYDSENKRMNKKRIICHRCLEKMSEHIKI